MAELPTGTVTFLFTDIEGSTRLLQALGEKWLPTLEDHHRLLRGAIRDAGGLDLRTEGDAFFAVFSSAPGAVAAATNAQRALAGHAWSGDATVRVRMGMHTGDGAMGGDDYIGLDVHRAARIASAGHGGQVLLSDATRALVEADLPQGVGVRDLGAHRLKDLARPEHLYQLAIPELPSEFPPLRTLGTPTNLPAPRTSFVGREAEVARVKELLRGPGLLTLTGPGGSGKTRLALEAARALLDDYPDGVFFVELGPVSDPRLIASTVAMTVGVRSEGARSTLEMLQEHLRDRELLLVLDNLEQLAEGSSVVGELLTAAPRLRVLATSRELLHLSGEQELAVPPLSLPDPSEPAERVAEAEAVGLFVARAGTVDPGFRLTEENAAAVAELCRRLDGLPLAIELAASRLRLLSPQAILERLEHRLELLTGGPVDLPARQRTLREAIAWSHDLLDEPERAVFRRLSVFSGGSTLEAAESVAGEGLDAGVFEALGSLVDKSLVTRDAAPSGTIRFGMLETIREFAGEQLDAGGESEASRDRHLAYFHGRAEAAEPNLRSVDQVRWLDELEVEHDNLRAALRRAIDSGQAPAALRMAAALWRFWQLHGHFGEGRRWTEEALAMPGSAARTAERERALNALGGMAYWQQDVDGFGRAYEEALDIALELGHRRAEAEQMYNLAYRVAAGGEIAGAVAMCEDALARARELGFDRLAGDCLFFLSIGSRLAGDLPTARALAEESLRLHRQLGDRFGSTIALYALGRNAFAQGDMDTARTSFLEALGNDELVGNRTGMAVVFDNLGAQAGMRGDHVRALRLAGSASALKEAVGGEAPPGLIGIPDPREMARGVLSDAAVTAAWEEGRAMMVEQAIAYAREEF